MKMVFTRKFEAAHRLMSDKSLKCQNPHGHSWVVKVTIEATPKHQQPLDLDINMVEEFGAAKKLWHTWIDEYVDHSIMLNQNDAEFIEVIRRVVPHTRLMLIPGDPTTEVTCALFKSKCQAFLESVHDERLECSRIELIETPTNTVVFDGNELEHLPPGKFCDIEEYEQYWWHRADMSTNDIKEVDNSPDTQTEADLDKIAIDSADHISKLIPEHFQGIGVGSLDGSENLQIIIYLKKSLQSEQEMLILGYYKKYEVVPAFNVIGEVTVGG